MPETSQSFLVITLNCTITRFRTVRKLSRFATAFHRGLYQHKLSAKWV